MISTSKGDEWHAGHTIGVYLCVDEDSLLVGTARARSDLSHLFRYLADEWDRMVADSPLRACDENFSAMEVVLSAGSHPARGA